MPHVKSNLREGCCLIFRFPLQWLISTSRWQGMPPRSLTNKLLGLITAVCNIFPLHCWMSSQTMTASSSHYIKLSLYSSKSQKIIKCQPVFFLKVLSYEWIKNSHTMLLSCLPQEAPSKNMWFLLKTKTNLKQAAQAASALSSLLSPPKPHSLSSHLAAMSKQSLSISFKTAGFTHTYFLPKILSTGKN